MNNCSLYLGIVNHYQDPYKTTSISWKVIRACFVAHLGKLQGVIITHILLGNSAGDLFGMVKT